MTRQKWLAAELDRILCNRGVYGVYGVKELNYVVVQGAEGGKVTVRMVDIPQESRSSLWHDRPEQVAARIIGQIHGRITISVLDDERPSWMPEEEAQRYR